jgi:hypothetical protein
VSDLACVELLHGPYTPPSVREGDRATCLYRGCEVLVVGRSEAPLPWPLARAPGSHGRPAPLVDAELALAVCSEAAGAVCWWWGVSAPLVARWRDGLGVTAKIVAGRSQPGGQLTAIRRTRQDAQYRWLWECRCSCGRTVEVLGTAFTTGRKKRCGSCGDLRRGKRGKQKDRRARDQRRADMLALRGQGLTLAEIGQRYGITRRAVGNFLSRP